MRTASASAASRDHSFRREARVQPIDASPMVSLPIVKLAVPAHRSQLVRPSFHVLDSPLFSGQHSSAADHFARRLWEPKASASPRTHDKQSLTKLGHPKIGGVNHRWVFNNVSRPRQLPEHPCQLLASVEFPQPWAILGYGSSWRVVHS